MTDETKPDKRVRGQAIIADNRKAPHPKCGCAFGYYAAEECKKRVAPDGRARFGKGCAVDGCFNG